MQNEGMAATLTRGVDRRQFLAAAGAMGATGWLLGPNALADQHDGGVMGDLARSAGRTLSVGYVLGSRAAGGAFAGLKAGARVVPAARLRAGDRALHGPATIGVLGVTAGLDHAVAGGLSHLYLDALVPAPRPLDQDTTLPFFAWSLTPGSPARQSPPVSFATTISSTPRLAFSIDAPGAVAGPGQAVFTTGRNSGMAKLREGLYLLAVGDGVWDRERTLPDPANEADWAGLLSMLVRVAPAA
jgi:hypothetical protein